MGLKNRKSGPNSPVFRVKQRLRRRRNPHFQKLTIYEQKLSKEIGLTKQSYSKYKKKNSQKRNSYASLCHYAVLETHHPEDVVLIRAQLVLPDLVRLQTCNKNIVVKQDGKVDV